MKKNVEAQRLYYKKVLAVQKTFLEHWKEGISKKFVYRKHIKDKYYIGVRTFQKYLSINARRELKKLA